MTIDIFMVGSTLTKTESFCIKLSKQGIRIGSFSPATYRVSILDRDRRPISLVVLDIRTSECLLRTAQSDCHCFSSDGGFFAASFSTCIYIWRYTSGSYVPWRKLNTHNPVDRLSLLFSPTSSSILCHHKNILQVWHFDGRLTQAHSNNQKLLTVLSCCGTYIATSHEKGSTVTITNLHLQTPSQFIDVDGKIYSLRLTGNVLLVIHSDGFDHQVIAWRLMENGVVDGVFANRRAGHSDSIWNVSGRSTPMFFVEGQVVTIELGPTTLVYHTRTGEVLKPTGTHSHIQERYTSGVYCSQLYPNYHRIDEKGTPSKGGWLVSRARIEEGWVKDPEGKHRLWIPIEWKIFSADSGWFHDITTLRLCLAPTSLCEPVIIMF